MFVAIEEIGNHLHLRILAVTCSGCCRFESHSSDDDRFNHGHNYAGQAEQLDSANSAESNRRPEIETLVPVVRGSYNECEQDVHKISVGQIVPIELVTCVTCGGHMIPQSEFDCLGERERQRVHLPYQRVEIIVCEFDSLDLECCSDEGISVPHLVGRKSSLPQFTVQLSVFIE